MRYMNKAHKSVSAKQVTNELKNHVASKELYL